MLAAAPAQSAGEPNPLDEAFRKLAVLELGQDLQQFHSIRQAAAEARTEARVRVDLEDRLVGILEGDATDLAKDYACLQLVTVGTDAAVPALAALLPDPRASFMARTALEGIGSPAAAKAFRAMLDKTQGEQQVGVVISLGRLADAEAVAAIARLLPGDDKELREACLVALGRIGTVPAAESLAAFAGKTRVAPPDVVDALLAAAEALCRRGEHAAAAEICQSLLAAESLKVRGAAFRGLVAAKPSESLAMIVAGLGGDEDWKRAVAADCVVQLGAEDVRAIAAAIADLPAAGKIAALVSLADRSDPAVRTAALRTLNDRDNEVRVAALAALIRSGTADDVPVLAGLATEAAEPPVREAAFETLRLMPDGGVDHAMVSWMETAEPPAAIVRCAAARRAAEFVPAFLKAARAPSGATRLEAWKGLEVMAAGKDAAALVDLLGKTPPGEEREAADRAVWMACQQISDPAERSAVLLAAMEKGDESTQTAILPTLARMGGEKALQAVRKAMQHEKPAVRDAGHRALANWSDASVAEELLEIAKTSDVESYRVWSLRAYARLVALPSDRPPHETFEMLQGAMPLAVRREDKELFLSRLAAVRTPDALALLLTFVDDAELRGAAVPAVFTLAKGLSQSHPGEAAAALTAIQPLAEDPAIRQQIPKVLRDIENRKR